MFSARQSPGEDSNPSVSGAAVTFPPPLSAVISPTDPSCYSDKFLALVSIIKGIV